MGKDKNDLFICPRCGTDGQRYVVTGEIAGERVFVFVGPTGNILDTPNQARYIGRENELLISTIRCPTCETKWTPDTVESLEDTVRRLLGLRDFYA